MKVKNALLETFNSLDGTFYGWEANNALKRILKLNMRYVDTTMRELRGLRKEGLINFNCIKRKESLCKKMEV